MKTQQPSLPCSLLLVGLNISILLFTSCSPSQTEAREDQAMTNRLEDIGKVFLTQEPQWGDRYPQELADLDPKYVDPSLFVLPGAEKAPADLTRVDEWTDYVYVGGFQTQMLLGAALLISPPENHRGKHGYVLFTEYQARRLPADTVRLLIKDPLLLVEPADDETIKRARTLMKIRIPEKHKSYRTGDTNAETDKGD